MIKIGRTLICMFTSWMYICVFIYLYLYVNIIYICYCKRIGNSVGTCAKLQSQSKNCDKDAAEYTTTPRPCKRSPQGHEQTTTPWELHRNTNVFGKVSFLPTGNYSDFTVMQHVSNSNFAGTFYVFVFWFEVSSFILCTTITRPGRICISSYCSFPDVFFCVHSHIHVYIYTHTHTHIYIYTHTFALINNRIIHISSYFMNAGLLIDSISTSDRKCHRPPQYAHKSARKPTTCTVMAS